MLILGQICTNIFQKYWFEITIQTFGNNNFTKHKTMKKLVFQTCILVKGVLISSQRRSGVQRPQRLKTDPLWRHRITREITSSKPSLPSLSQEVGVDTSVLCNILVLITSAIVSHQILVLYTIAPKHHHMSLFLSTQLRQL